MGATATGVAGAAIGAATADVHAPTSNTAAIVTYAAAGAGICHVITGIAYSYLGIPVGALTIEDGSGNVVLSLDTAIAGIGSITFPRGKKGSANTAMIITLAAGGVAITGKLSILGHWTEPG